MTSSSTLLRWAAFTALVAGCGGTITDDRPTTDAGSADAGRTPDAGPTVDAGPRDAGPVLGTGTLALLAGGLGGTGNTDGAANAARFSGPRGIAADGAGNLYVADTLNHTIRKVTPAGVVTTMAGSPGLHGSTDGTGSAARFFYPTGIAADGAGNLYVADSSNSTVRKVTPAGVVTTLAGRAGQPGGEDGTGTAASFNGPYGVAVDGAGNVYVADTGNDTIRKVTPAGVVTTLAGAFEYPGGVAVDGAGNVYVADTQNDTICVVTPAGVVTTLAGMVAQEGDADGTGATASFDRPGGLAVDSAGDVYVADTYDDTIRRITPAGEVTTLAGTAWQTGGADGTGSAASFNTPYGVAIDDAGNVVVIDTDNESVRKVTPAGVVTTLAGATAQVGGTDATGAAARFNLPSGVAVDGEGNAYVADTDNDVIRKVTPAGVVTTLAGTAGHVSSADGTGSAAGFNLPAAVVVDTAGNVYVADTFNLAVRVVTPAGVVTTLAGAAGQYGYADGTGSAASFLYPAAIAVDGSGTLYVADTGNDTIRTVTPAGVVTTIAGQVGSGGSSDGPGRGAQFNQPSGIAVDSAGDVYVADTGNDTIRKMTPDGVFTTLAGRVGTCGSADGTGSAATFCGPQGIAVDGAGVLYVADTLNETIRKVTPAGVVTTLAGVAGIGSVVPRPLPALLSLPTGIATAPSGALIIADACENVILVVTP